MASGLMPSQDHKTWWWTRWPANQKYQHPTFFLFETGSVTFILGDRFNGKVHWLKFSNLIRFKKVNDYFTNLPPDCLSFSNHKCVFGVNVLRDFVTSTWIRNVRCLKPTKSPNIMLKLNEIIHRNYKQNEFKKRKQDQMLFKVLRTPYFLKYLVHVLTQDLST